MSIGRANAAFSNRFLISIKQNLSMSKKFQKPLGGWIFLAFVFTWGYLRF